MKKPEQQLFAFLAAPPPVAGEPNLVIEAGAGTGKTTRIVREVLDHLLRNESADPERLALVTFTEKAAAEIADRIRGALIDLQGSLDTTRRWPSDSDSPIVSIDERDLATARRALDRHVANLDRFRSQTIHSFCQSFLRLHAVHADLDPQFEIIQGAELMRLQDEAWNAFLDAETEDPGSPFVDDWRTLLHHFQFVDFIRRAVFDILPKRDLLADESYTLGDIAEAHDTLLADLDVIRRMPQADADAVTNAVIAEVIRHFRTAPPPQEVSVAAWLTFLEPVVELLEKVNLTYAKKFKDAIRTFRDLHETLSSHLSAQALRAVTVRFAKFLDARKRAEGVVDFDDLLFRAATLMEDPRVVQDIRSRYDLIFVDEFQDTDRIQARILDRLARDASGRMQGTRIILVGDPKQSIYSFRRADPETYERTVETFLAEGARREVLDRQFRSDPALVADLNTMFAAVFAQPSSENVARPSYERLSAAKQTDGWKSPRLTFLRATPGASKTGHAAQAAVLARWILERHETDGRPFRDFAILFRRRTNLAEYLSALERAGVPCVLPPARLFLESEPTVNLVAVLRAIASPYDRSALVAAARSPYFALTDDEIAAGLLLRDAEAGGVWAEFRSEIDRWEQLARQLTIADLVETILSSTQMHLLTAATHDAESTSDVLRRMVVLADEFDRTTGGDVAQFVAEIDRRRKEMDDSDPSWIDETADAVKILTVHGAKGLEFETVILPDLMSQPNKDGMKVHAVEAPKTLLMSGRVKGLAGKFRRAGSQPLDEIVKEREEAEVDRLFYVGVTRAKRDVCFVLDNEKLKTEGFAKPMCRAFGVEKIANLWTVNGRQSLTSLSGTIDVSFEEIDPGDDAASVRRALRDGVMVPVELPPFSAGAGPDLPLRPAGELAAQRAASKNRTTGTLIHRVLELWDGREGTLDSYVERVAAEEGCDRAELDVLRARTGGLRTSKVLARLQSSTLVGREVPLYFTDEEGARHAVRIDRLLLERDRHLVVDYKTGSSSSPRRAHDEAQVRSYCELVSRLTGTACEGLLWYLEDDVAVEVAG